MKITIAVDANPIISALIGGVSREVFFNHHFNFITTEFTLREVKRYLPMISKKSGVNMKRVSLALSLLPITAHPKTAYKQNIPEADKLIGRIDKKDVDILALALFIKCPLWSNDRDFETVEGITLLKTKDLS